MSEEWAEEGKKTVRFADMKLKKEPFEQIENMEKTIELRLFDEKRKFLQTGDIIRFREENGKTVFAKVTELKPFSSFEEAFGQEGVLERALPGASCVEEGCETMRRYYSEEEERACGVLCIGLEKY